MDHYDANGQNAGYSVPGILGGANHYDGSGNYAGFSTPNILSGNTYHGVDDDPPDPFEPFRDSGFGDDDGFI